MKINNIRTIYRGACTMLLMLGLLSIHSCDDDFGDINKNYEANIYEANVPGLFAGLLRSLQKEGAHYRIPVAWLYQWNQQAAMYSASGYRLDDNTTQPWQNYYKNLANSYDIEHLIAEEEDASSMTNILAMTKVVMAYKTLANTLLYGDMPYTEAGKGFFDTSAFRPTYDDQQSIMHAAIEDLTWAMDNLSTSGTQVSIGASDVLFGNDVSQWIKFTNSLRLRYAMVMVEKDASFAEPIIADALTKPLLAANENVWLDPGVTTVLNNREGFFRGNSYMRMGSTMFNAMSSTNAVDGSGIYDLRCPILFEPNEDDEWVPYPQVPDNTTPTVTGNPHVGARLTDWNSNRSNFATFNVYYVQDHTIPQFILTGSQVSFLKAEIYNRGLAGVAANPAMAQTFYEEGITASVNFWYNHAFNSIWSVNKPAAAAPTATELNDMLTHPEVAYSADAATALSQIYKQSWIAMIHQPFEAWNLQRRTNNATPNVSLPSTSLVTDFNRLTYPPSERETNRTNWTAITGGTDSEKIKIWIQP
ncbi:SusD/RagB family nutrient-binding outer membrane lipoprotein [Snuella lapsa]